MDLYKGKNGNDMNYHIIIHYLLSLKDNQMLKVNNVLQVL